MTVSIYHELQESALCGQHCLNNLVQENFFTAVHLSEIAAELDSQEQALMDTVANSNSGSPFKSYNVDDMGNFSIQVLHEALRRYHNIELIPWHDQATRSTNNNNNDNNSNSNSYGTNSTTDVLEEKGIVVNRSEHWFTIRKINNNWWNLNSTLDAPELISPFYLSAFLYQLRNDGYNVFIAKGNVNTSGVKNNDNYVPVELGRWYTEQELLQPRSNRATATATEEKAVPSPFAGKGYKLGTENNNGGATTDSATDPFDPTEFMVEGEEGDMEEILLARAISASLQEQPKAKEPTKEELRAKRLAALEKK